MTDSAANTAANIITGLIFLSFFLIIIGITVFKERNRVANERNKAAHKQAWVNTIVGFQPGVTTMQDVIAQLGSPQAVSNHEEGSVLLQWVQPEIQAAIFFAHDGKMIQVMSYAVV